MTQAMITRFSLSDSQMTLVFASRLKQCSSRNSKGFTPSEGVI